MEVLKTNKNILSQTYGVELDGDQTHFKVWSPLSKKIELRIFKDSRAIRRKTYAMTMDEDGIWSVTVNKNLDGQFYTYVVDDKYEVVDPYAYSAGGNSTKAAIVDPRLVNPEGFINHERPGPSNPLDAILYEAHIKDFTMGKKTPFEHKGLYLGFTETGLVMDGQKVGIDHLVELGVTHVHLLPVYDFLTVNDYDKKTYNWGYDPYLFNTPEGSYSSDPDDPKSRILELKLLVQTLHEHGIKVVLDVVYNHTYFGGESNFHRLMPYVFHRTDGTHFHNGSGCGNELDTENPMVRKFIMDSLKYWLEVYQVDGFRFDLMGLYDAEFVELMSNELHDISPDIILYGEPWTGGPSGLKHENQFLKGKQRDLKVALFNDDFRNAIKGSNDESDAGFVGVGKYRKDDVYAGCLGSIKFSNEIVGFAKKPSETINYVSSHDNLILMDKITKAFPHADFEKKQNMNALAISLVILSLGIPFLQAGTEMLRSKYGDHNSYKSGYYINRLHWENKKKFRHVFDYTKKLIDFRHSQMFYDIDDPKEIIKMVQIIPTDSDVIYYKIRSPYEEDYKVVHFIFNGGFESKIFEVHDAELEIDGALYYREHVKVEKGLAYVPKLSAAVLIEKREK